MQRLLAVSLAANAVLLGLLYCSASSSLSSLPSSPAGWQRQQNIVTGQLSDLEKQADDNFKELMKAIISARGARGADSADSSPQLSSLSHKSTQVLQQVQASKQVNMRLPVMDKCGTESWTSWSEHRLAIGKEQTTSVAEKSDTYLEDVQKALLDDAFFRTKFKLSNGYASIVATERDGLKHNVLDELLRSDPEALHGANLAGLLKHNLIGGGRLHNVTKIGVGVQLGPSMLKYAAQVSDMTTLFGSLSGFNVVEIGVGYGGLAHTMMTRHRLQSYVFVDLPDVEKLVRKYLREVGTPTETRLIFPDLLTEAERQGLPSLPKIDLLVSNNALSEVPTELQTFYLQIYASCAERGYLIINGGKGMSDDAMAGVLRSQYKKNVAVFKSKLQNDRLLSYNMNPVVTWRPS